MKVNYLLKNKSKRPYLRRILILILIFVFGATFFYFATDVVITIISPVWRAENVVVRNLRNSVVFLNSQKNLLQENTTLKERISSLELRVLALSKNQTQDRAFLELIGREREEGTIVAVVLTHPPQTPYDIIIIDAGSRDSITLGMKVSLPEGPILGTVSEVFSRSAKVRLFSANGEETNAILERNNVPVILVGVGGGNFKLALPQDIEVEKGDGILSLGVVSQLLATVGEIKIKPTDSFKEVLAKSPTNIFTLRLVFVTP